MRGYVGFTKDQFEKFLNESKVPFQIMNIPGTHEIVYDVPLALKPGEVSLGVVRIHSTLKVGQGQARDVGKDAVRIGLFRIDKFATERNPFGMPVFLGKKPVEMTAFRTENCFSNTLDRVRKMVQRGRRQTCPNCGTLMVHRENKGSPFYGCPEFRVCGAKSKTVQFVEQGQ